MEKEIGILCHISSLPSPYGVGDFGKTAYEFIDFYCYGIAHQYLKKAGFSLLSQEDGNIIPNYFEPFERENVKIRIVVAHWPSFHLYRGDGDQDRPSIPRR